MEPKNLTSLVQNRQLFHGLKDGNSLLKKAYINESFLNRLGLEHALVGHRGCVNCVQWCDSGRFLLSGSDDTKAILWDPFRKKLLNIFDTHHVGNIFSVKKITNNSGSYLVTAAADARITVQNFNSVVYEPVFVCTCHCARIKQLATTPNEPHLFWSAAEDGLILQFDLREKHNCQTNGTTALLDLFNLINFRAEAKCLSIHPFNSFLIAVGSNDPHVRVFDRRKLKTLSYKNRLPTGEFSLIASQFREPVQVPYVENCAQFYSPQHLFNGELTNRLTITHIAYNSSGTKLLANIGSDHVYTFDLNSNRNETVKRYPLEIYRNPDNFLNGNVFRKKVADCSNCVQRIKRRLNNSINTSKTPKVKQLNDEIANSPCYCKYFERGLALKKRNWSGDDYAALKDFLRVVSFYGQSKCIFMKIFDLFMSLNWFYVAAPWSTLISHKFPDVANDVEFKTKVEKLRSFIENDTTCFNVPHLGDIWQFNSQDYEKRYLGHCNIKTDIKEANFFGADDEFIVAGSDDGNIYFWDEKSTNVICALKADSSISNIVQPHPSLCLLASSGIDPVIRLWSPVSDISKRTSYEVEDLKHAIVHNQEQLMYENVNDLDTDIFRYVFDDQESNQICAPS